MPGWSLPLSLPLLWTIEVSIIVRLEISEKRELCLRRWLCIFVGERDGGRGKGVKGMDGVWLVSVGMVE